LNDIAVYLMSLMLKRFASAAAPMYVSTNAWEKTFFKMIFAKFAHWARLTDEHMKVILLVGCSKY